jgi:drug/metabolite transporter (DMT)-like permease
VTSEPMSATSPAMRLSLRQSLSRPSERLRASLALVVANTLWGTSFVATKPVLDHVPPVTIAVVRFVIAMAILWPIAARAGLHPRYDRTTAFLGFTGIFSMYTAQNVGLRFTSATNATLIQGGIPVLTALLAASCLRELLRPIQVIGIGLSLAALTGIVLSGAGAEASVSLRGDLLLAVSAASFAAYLVIGRQAFGQNSLLETVTGGIGWGMLFMVPVATVEVLTQDVKSVTPRDGALLLYLGAGSSGLVFLLWAYALRHLEAGRAAIFGNLNPLVGVLAAALVLGESLTPAVLAGGLLLLIGIWLTNRPEQVEELVPSAESGARLEQIEGALDQPPRSATEQLSRPRHPAITAQDDGLAA